MNYPLISEYIEAIKSVEDNFEELSYLKPVLGDDGSPVMTSGNFAVVFKMKDEQSGKFYAVKCFTKEQEGRAEAYREITKELKDVSSPYLVSIQYMEKELFVDTDQTTETEFPVLLMDWVEGKTLDKYLRENLDDKYALEMLAYRFSQLAQWLIPQPFAHGDLKPDNILVREDGTLVLVDYDGMYVPAMKGQKAREIGSPDFRHPQRTEDDFDEHVDDFPLVSILLSLKCISYDSRLYDEFGTFGRFLLSEKDYIEPYNCLLLKRLFPSTDNSINIIVSIYYLCLVMKTQELLSLLKQFCSLYDYSTSANEVLLDSAININHILYSSDRRKLIKLSEIKDVYDVPDEDCHIPEGTEIICDNAFKVRVWGYPVRVWLPRSIMLFGKDVFTTESQPGITEIVVPVGLEKQYTLLLPQYKHLISIYTTKVPKNDIMNGIKDSHGVIYSKDGNRLLSCPNRIDVKEVLIREGTKVICDEAFCGGFSFYLNGFISVSELERIIIPDSVEIIGGGAFQRCVSLKEIVLPESLKKIREGAFAGSSINRVDIPYSVDFIGEGAFYDCTSLRVIVFSGPPPFIAEYAFSGCSSIEEISVPSIYYDEYEQILNGLRNKLKIVHI